MGLALGLLMAASAVTCATASATATTENPVGADKIRTYYFSTAKNWEIPCYYTWNGETGEKLADFPGTEMKEVGKAEVYNYDTQQPETEIVFGCQIDVSKYDQLIFAEKNGHHQQTTTIDVNKINTDFFTTDHDNKASPVHGAVITPCNKLSTVRTDSQSALVSDGSKRLYINADKATDVPASSIQLVKAVKTDGTEITIKVNKIDGTSSNGQYGLTLPQGEYKSVTVLNSYGYRSTVDVTAETDSIVLSNDATKSENAQRIEFTNGKNWGDDVKIHAYNGYFPATQWENDHSMIKLDKTGNNGEKIFIADVPVQYDQVIFHSGSEQSYNIGISVAHSANNANAFYQASNGTISTYANEQL